MFRHIVDRIFLRHSEFFFHPNLLFVKDILGMVISALSFYTTMFHSEEKLPIVETVPSELELGEFDKRFGVDVLPLTSTDLSVLLFACWIDIEERRA